MDNNILYEFEVFGDRVFIYRDRQAKRNLDDMRYWKILSFNKDSSLDSLRQQMKSSTIYGEDTLFFSEGCINYILKIIKNKAFI